MEPRDDDAQHSVEAWMACARADLKAADLLICDESLGPLACFHAQQAAEKALKAYLAWLSDDEIPRTHDIARLADLAVARGGPAPPQAGLRPLSEQAVASRYPGPNMLSTRDASQFLTWARELVEFVHTTTGFPADGVL